MPTKSRTYHHGDLRRALIAAAVDLLATADHRDVTLRAVARRAGVSHQAPYNHFLDADALLAAVAEQGFHTLSAALRATQRRFARSPLLALREIGVTYVVFAVRHPAYWRLMFSERLANRRAYSGLAAAASETFSLLSAPMATNTESEDSAPSEPFVDADRRVLLWSTTHGIAALLVDGQLGPNTPTSAARYARRLLDVLRPIAA